MQSFYKEKKVLITGGSSGIGKALAIKLFSVVVIARNQKKLDQALYDICQYRQNTSQRLNGFSLDVTNRSKISALKSDIIDSMAGLDLLVNNSGVAIPQMINQTSDEHIDQMMQVNYLGCVNMTRAFLEPLKQNGGGQICFVSSRLGFMGLIGYSAYAASKYAVRGFAECLRQELFLDNINVHLFFPPTTQTPGLLSENAYKPDVTWAIEGKCQTFEAAEVAHAILKGIQRKKFVNMIGWQNWLVYYLEQYTPSILRWMIDSQIKKYVSTNINK